MISTRHAERGVADDPRQLKIAAGALAEGELGAGAVDDEARRRLGVDLVGERGEPLQRIAERRRRARRQHEEALLLTTDLLPGESQRERLRIGCARGERFRDDEQTIQRGARRERILQQLVRATELFGDRRRRDRDRRQRFDALPEREQREGARGRPRA